MKRELNRKMLNQTTDIVFKSLMNKFLALLLLFGIVGCASGALERFPVSSYVDDKESVELNRFFIVHIRTNWKPF